MICTNYPTKLFVTTIVVDKSLMFCCLNSAYAHDRKPEMKLNSCHPLTCSFMSSINKLNRFTYFHAEPVCPNLLSASLANQDAFN